MADRREYDCVYLCKGMVYDSICIQAHQKCICMYLRESVRQTQRDLNFYINLYLYINKS